MMIYKERAGTMSKKSCWVCIHEGYMYISDTVRGLIEILNEEWEHDKWLAM
jgi:hypothetical protein